ncbi:hypothetical protein [Natrinema caseinilyticum]|uniref:hypothetical protein n=1 Tax=Natrinema caseinilyticum TaxID=2961570 RepID=UPI0020C36DCD|nr:hypothetical protein [Natrinema caseinilyticum]
MGTHDELTDRVHEILTRAEASSGSLVLRPSSDGETDAATADLLAAAREARDLLESTDPRRVLEALGLATLPDGSEADSIPEAIARGESAQLESLERLLNLAKLASRSDDGELGGAVEGLRETIGEADESTDAAEASDGVGDESERVSSADGPGATAAERDETDESAEESAERLRSAVQSSVSDVGTQLQQLRDQLEAAKGEAGDAEDDTSGEDASNEAETEETDPDEEIDGESSTLEFGTAGGRDSASNSGGRHSTMAPPPSKRADMRGPPHFSTMPDKRGD